MGWPDAGKLPIRGIVTDRDVADSGFHHPVASDATDSVPAIFDYLEFANRTLIGRLPSPGHSSKRRPVRAQLTVSRPHVQDGTEAESVVICEELRIGGEL